MSGNQSSLRTRLAEASAKRQDLLRRRANAATITRSAMFGGFAGTDTSRGRLPRDGYAFWAQARSGMPDNRRGGSNFPIG
jgi:hypothetical protein